MMAEANNTGTVTVTEQPMSDPSQQPPPPQSEVKDPNFAQTMQPQQGEAMAMGAMQYPAEPPPPYAVPPGGYQHPPMGYPPGQPVAGYPPPQPYYGAAPGMQPQPMPVTATTTTYVIKDDPPPQRVNHCCHCIISILFWPWFFVWCCMCIMESREMDRWQSRQRSGDY